MNKCVSLSAVLVTLISATAPEDICETCVPISKCSMFANMGRREQQYWTRKYPCNNRHPDDYGTRPGSRITHENFICCPNQIWGVDQGYSSRITDETRFGNPKEDTRRDQSQYSYSYGSYRQNKDGIEDNDAYFNLNSNTQWSSGQNTNTRIEPSRWGSTPKNRYWNDRPDESKWDIGNQNFYHGNNNNRYFNNRRNNFDNDQRGRGNSYNQGRNQPGSSNNQGFERNDNDSRYNPNNPNNRGSGNTSGNSGQCDRLTSFPPDPKTGCCGREAPDDDRITGTPFKLNDKNQLETKLTKTIDDAPIFSDYYAPESNNRGWDEREPPSYEWSYSMFKEEGTNTVTVNNKTVTVVNGGVAVENRISGGKETELTQYPWTALLVTMFENGLQRTAFNCGGSLISARFVLTAGHCVYDAEAVMKGVQVFLAEYDKRSFPRDCKITAEGRKCIENFATDSENVILHPRFDETRLQNDIALIKLLRDAPYTEYIRPICLPSINIDNPEHNRLPLAVAGWGRNGQYKSDIKQSTTVHLVPQHDCKKYYLDLTRRHLCAAGYTGEDTCKGDSGGPLMVLYRGKYYVVGVVSGKRTDAPCGSTVPSLYTNVYHYLDWIRRNIAS